MTAVSAREFFSSCSFFFLSDRWSKRHGVQPAVGDDVAVQPEDDDPDPGAGAAAGVLRRSRRHADRRAAHDRGKSVCV